MTIANAISTVVADTTARLILFACRRARVRINKNAATKNRIRASHAAHPRPNNTDDETASTMQLSARLAVLASPLGTTPSRNAGKATERCLRRDFSTWCGSKR
jgi:hypothetical protein